jgi:hypothetical protein
MRSLLLAGIVAFTAGLLTGCGSSSSSAGPVKAADGTIIQPAPGVEDSGTKPIGGRRPMAPPPQ